MGCVVITLSFSSVTLMTVSSVRGKRAANGGKVTLTNPSLPDQPNRAVRTRMLRGVGGPPCEGRSYPVIFFFRLNGQLQTYVIH